MGHRVALPCHRNPWLAVLLLAAIFTHALIPVGFMPGPDGLMLCPGYVSAATRSGADSMAQDDMPGMDMLDHGLGLDHRGKRPAHENVGICPFAAAGTALESSHTAAPAVYTPVVLLEITFAPQPFVPSAAVALTRLPRGPPAFG
jgi:hypothetical protein